MTIEKIARPKPYKQAIRTLIITVVNNTDLARDLRRARV